MTIQTRARRAAAASLISLALAACGGQGPESLRGELGSEETPGTSEAPLRHAALTDPRTDPGTERCPVGGCPGDGDPEPVPRTPPPPPVFPNDYPPAPNPNCPAAAPTHADWPILRCKAFQNTMRCFQSLTFEQCMDMIAKAESEGAITAAAATWARYHQWCPLNFGATIVSLCPSGCFDPSTRIDVAGPPQDGPEPKQVAIAQLQRGDALAGLSDGTSLVTPRFTSRTIQEVIAGPESHDMVVFELDSGRTLSVTERHAMVLVDGTLQKAQDVKQGAAFVDRDGNAVVVLSVRRAPATAPVVNVKLVSPSTEGHVLVAEGVLTGDNYLQNITDIDEDLAIARRR